TGQVFLGQRLACAQCHHHPYEKWSQDDYWGFAAYFGRLGRKNMMVPGGVQNQPVAIQAIFNRSSGAVVNKRTGQAAVMKALDAPPETAVPGDVDPRQKLVGWMVEAKNPIFPNAVVNPYSPPFFRPPILHPL